MPIGAAASAGDTVEQTLLQCPAQGCCRVVGFFANAGSDKCEFTGTLRETSPLYVSLRTILTLWIHVYRFRVDKFLDPIAAQLPSITRLLDTAERQARIGCDQAVYESRPGLEFSGDSLAALHVFSEDRGAQSEDRVVRDTDRVDLVFCLYDRGHGTKELIVITRHACFYVA